MQMLQSEWSRTNMLYGGAENADMQNIPGCSIYTTRFQEICTANLLLAE